MWHLSLPKVGDLIFYREPTSGAGSRGGGGAGVSFRTMRLPLSQQLLGGGTGGSGARDPPSI